MCVQTYTFMHAITVSKRREEDEFEEWGKVCDMFGRRKWKGEM